jgi:hypothetical protein
MKLVIYLIKKSAHGFILLGLILNSNQLFAQIGLVKNSIETVPGYTLFQTNNYTNTYLINNSGEVVHEWAGTYEPGVCVYLLANGLLLRSGKISTSFNMGGVGGYLELVRPSGEIEWSYTFVYETQQSHHDVSVLPNGNILVLLIDAKTELEAIQAGRNPSTLNTNFSYALWSETIIEIKPIGSNDIEVVWQWNLWDHLIQDYDETKSNYGIVSETPWRLDINYYKENQGLIDWVHFNAIDYNPALDQILLSSPFLDEIYVIDHSTTSQEASSSTGGIYGKGGDFLFRWGNPEAYRKGTQEDQKLFGQHNAQWKLNDQNEWEILLYNNGKGRTENYSTIDIIRPQLNDITYGRDANGVFYPSNSQVVYSADPPTSFYSSFISGVQPFENGHYLICEGAKGKFFEINSAKEVVWEYINPVNASGPQCKNTFEGVIINPTFRVTKYALDYSGLPDLTESPYLLEEINCPLDAPNQDFFYTSIFPNPFTNELNFIGFQNIEKITIYDLEGKINLNLSAAKSTELNKIDLSEIGSGIYIVSVSHNNSISSYKVVKQ